eukprot:gnl/Hemi2/19469_TR6467_c0_g1_i1.p1 gnl/Hemi2/19469_TR6467_c0_g1~~gnl/Hemi2/19469_TR6467_c0_g1_i1.p1  ORF type:complete len:285 (-),score=24.51 gnl/Hemi2/19469_TR6467_c0_g1_i1:62-916(-)
MVVVRRNRPGTSNSGLFAWPPQPLETNDGGTFGVQQYIERLIRTQPSDVDTLCKCPHSQNPAVWQYEHLRQFCRGLGQLVVLLDEECTQVLCPIMKMQDTAVFLCAAHRGPLECSAIDYAVHTLDQTSALLNSSKWFPSRVTIPINSLRTFESVARRLYRVLGHAYFHHRAIFIANERETFLCARFSAFVRAFQLMSEELLVIPANCCEDPAPPPEPLLPPTPAAKSTKKHNKGADDDDDDSDDSDEFDDEDDEDDDGASSSSDSSSGEDRKPSAVRHRGPRRR